MASSNPLDFMAAARGPRRSASAAGARPQPSGWLAQARTEFAAVVLGSRMNVLLLPLPFALAGHAAGWPPGATFVLALPPLCSLAERLGMVTEQLAMHTTDSIGGLLNATFGNATEVIIAAFAISKGYLRVVKLTLLGSIVSNLLLVLGSACIAGGAFHSMLHFNQKGASITSGLLILTVIAIALPTLLSFTSDNPVGPAAELALSRFESVMLLGGYAAFLVFQLVTHRFLYEGDLMAGEAPQKLEASASGGRRGPTRPGLAPAPGGALGSTDSGVCPSCGSGGGGGPQGEQRQGERGRRHVNVLQSDLELVAFNGGGGGAPDADDVRIDVGQQQQHQQQYGGGGGPRGLPAAGGSSASLGGGWDESERAALMSPQGGGRSAPDAGPAAAPQFEEEDEEECVLSLAGALVWLAVITVAISFLSDAVMSVINAASKQLKVPMPFLTTIVVPIVGNAAEHASALMFAVRNRMEVALGVAVGSATQVGVLVMPFCVVLAWAMGQPLDLNFNEFEAAVLFISVLLAVVVLQDGSSNYLKGMMLVITYAFISASFWLHKDPQLTEAIDAAP